MDASIAALLHRHHARRFNDGESIEFAGTGILILAREYPDGYSALVTSLFARINAGSVARSLLRVQCAAALCEPNRDDLSAAD